MNSSLQFRPDIPRPDTPKLRWWHEALADYWLANPTASNIEAAKFFNRAPATISAIKNTDAFRAYFQSRQLEQRADLDAAVKSRMMGVAFTALDALHAKLQSKRDTLSVTELTKTLDTVANLSGTGPKAIGGVTVNVNQPTQQTLIAPVSMSDLEEARRALRAHQASLNPVIDGEVVPPVLPLPSKEPASS